MQSVRVFCPTKKIHGTITLSGSKSISNRVLLIRALCKKTFEIYNLSDSDDTKVMEQLLSSHNETYDVHHAGTAFRFLTAYLATHEGTQILTGSERMKQRPVRALVEALNYLGADIEYMDKEGFPPLKIKSPKTIFLNEITLPADISSQYISALLMIAPALPHGLILHLEGEIVSRPYIDMTIGIMKYFGVEVLWEGTSLVVKSQKYHDRSFHVEADWSAASYFYTIAVFSNQADIILEGLHKESLQGDSVMVQIGEKFGIDTIFGDNKIQLIKKKDFSHLPFFEHDFINEPDIAQSVSVLCAGNATSALMTGLQTLRIKETDRILALQKELAKVGVYLNRMPDRFSKKTNVEYYLQEGKAQCADADVPIFETYDDHRMAMAFSLLGVLFPVIIHCPSVVSKSYPAFWEDLKKLGFVVESTG